jgi:hypothetical protein
MARKIKEDAINGSYAGKLIDVVVDIRMSPETVERSYRARQLVQCTLPHFDPADVPVWVRTNGHLTLAIRPYVDLQTRKPLYPTAPFRACFSFGSSRKLLRRKAGGFVSETAWMPLWVTEPNVKAVC